jgi:hypothetical protein
VDEGKEYQTHVIHRSFHYPTVDNDLCLEY